MRHYETIFIVNPDLSEEDYGGVLKKFKDLLEKLNGVIVKVEEWGKQKMAYVVKRFDRGSYVLVDFCGEAGIIKEFERDLKLDDRILKFQTVKLHNIVNPQDLIEKEEASKRESEEKNRPDLEEKVIPQEETVVPQEETVVPQEETVVPQEETVVPQEETVVPQEETVVPQEEGTKEEPKGEIDNGVR